MSNLDDLLPKSFSDPFILQNRKQAQEILEAINEVLEWPNEETEGYIAKLECYRKDCIAYLQQTTWKWTWLAACKRRNSTRGSSRVRSSILRDSSETRRTRWVRK